MPAPTLDEFWQSLVSTRLLDAATLNEELTGSRKRPAYWWEGADGAQGYMGPAGGGDTAHADQDAG